MTEVVQRCFRAYETAERSIIEPLLTPDFTFTSPYDDHIDRATYFQRCWPAAGTFEKFELTQITEDADSCFVMYTGKRKRGSTFHNTERFVFDGEQIAEVEVFFGLPPYAATAVPPEQGIRAVLERRERAMQKRDAAAIVGLYMRDAVVFGLAPPLRMPSRQVQDPAELEHWFANWTGPIKTEMRDLRVTARGDLGFATLLERMVATASDGKVVDMWMRATYCLVQDNGTWKIASAHESVPFAMDGSMRALTDLTP